MKLPWQQRFLSWLMQQLPALLMTGGQVFLLGLSFWQAEWVANSQGVTGMLTAGMFTGWMLAVSRWRGWFAAVYGTFVGTSLAVQALARIVAPERFLNMPLWEAVNDIHLGYVAFELRLAGWIVTIADGGAVQDTGLFELAISLAGWAACLWLMWWAVRRRQAFSGVLPLYALMAVNAHLSRQPRMTMVYFAALVVILLLYSAYQYLRADWERRKVDYSEDLAVEWGFNGSLIALGVVAFALLFSLVGTPDGWQLLSDAVEKSRQQMSDTASQLFGGVKPPPPVPEEEPLEPPAVVNTPDLGEVGAPIADGNQTILYAWVSDPAPLPENIGGPPREYETATRHYWRSGIFGEYTGRGWQPVALSTQAATAQEDPAVPYGRYLLKQRFEVVARHQAVLFAVNDPVFSSNGTQLRQTLGDGSRVVEGRTTAYEVTSLATSVTVRALEFAGTSYPAEIRAQYLQLPEGLPARVRRLAEEITTGAETPYQKADWIQKYLRGRYEYATAVPTAPAGQDVVDYFLFDAPGGFCTYFASAMTVMLRMEGVPARIVSGYAMGMYDQEKAMYRVPASAAHAWVEVYFPELGWVEFEPTPAFSEFAYAPGLAPAGSAQTLPNLPVELPKPQKISQLWWLLVPVGAVAALWGMYFWYKAEKVRLANTGQMAVKLYRRVRRGLARAGIRTGPEQTELEFIDVAAPRLDDYPRLAEALERASQLYIDAEYSARRPAVEDISEGEWLWNQARGELLKLSLRAWLKTGRRKTG